MFLLESNEENGLIKIECLYNNKKQGELTFNTLTNEASLGLVEYANMGSGILTLRKAIPETEFSEYNIAKMLCDSFKNSYDVEGMKSFAPETFGLKSYRAMIAAEKFDSLSREELIEELINYEYIINSGGC